MLSIQYIKDNLNKVQEAIESKNVEFNLDDVLILDDKRRSIIVDVEQLKSKRNSTNKLISEYWKDKRDSSGLIYDLKEISSII